MKMKKNGVGLGSEPHCLHTRRVELNSLVVFAKGACKLQLKVLLHRLIAMGWIKDPI
jgi:hypothetical protein